ncbi:alpha/beta hydrolase fold domain-containing protein [Pseudopedobacter sp.]|uniref:alpha/beta hydrolase fold domain-containing protein n=1 Tax=Pseudopedobacter sp. TaxID=1936787 RepID=UPI003341358D
MTLENSRIVQFSDSQKHQLCIKLVNKLLKKQIDYMNIQMESYNQVFSIDESTPSWQTRLVICLLRLLKIKQKKASVPAVKKRLQKLKIQPASYEPKGLGSGIEVMLKHINEWPVYYTTPYSNSSIDSYVIFLHGGGYIDEIVPGHWKIIGEMNRKGKIGCIVPIYPLAPEATADKVVPAMGELLLKVFEEVGTKKVSIVGNSAGAALALASTQWLRDHDFRLPDKLVLISAGLDASYITQEQQEIAKIDPLLDIEGALYGAKLYAGDLDLNHPFVSPLNGDLHKLPPMLIFAGTLDFLYPNSIELKRKAESVGVKVDLYLKKGQPHNYPGLPTPEGKEALKVIINTIC